MSKPNTTLVNSSEVTASIRDLIVHLRRGNNQQAGSIVDNVTGHLKGIMQSGIDPQSFPMQRARQALFAIDEVRLLLSQHDFTGAVDAARDAEKEWRQRPAAESSK
jgi:acyl-CoA reductase-like NAD-dependent aldehyde dehydrogenase